MERLVAGAEGLGQLMLELSPGYRSDEQAVDDLAVFCEKIGCVLDDALVYRRFAFTGDRRALWGIV
ncbi:hypothetical protein TH66_00190 [Carbonactinospora thermoautotrophica]|uniref:Uncharacterized protein n=1 Tax=Carbonactinospora thermoautotrophica TaxID=1469144 RepID=A0A132N8V2_9ACTN|nr:hypothetical protein [Carbonactinospora thermoautotrophica]KWX04628.1 hypothetical protein TR74_24205 [Carbonactinospora thermoautotrophica]KWX05972.1 hypothetical protein TH66_00190 [Carbonactinospora thermoautotrophica]